jgi:mRNA-degrading endonuclease toxin of MazEF toxin-antitoxin module
MGHYQTTLRGSPTEVEVGPDEGLKRTFCVSLCSLLTVEQSRLRTFLGTVKPETMERACRALLVASGCI